MQQKQLVGVVIVVIALVGLGGLGYALLGKDMSKTADSSMSDSDMRNTGSGSFGSSEQEVDPMVRSGETSLDIKNFAFSVKEITVKKGTKVTWTNQDDAKHNVVADEKSDNAPDGRLLAQGETFEFTFDEVGTYDYHCSPHPYMKATVNVVE